MENLIKNIIYSSIQNFFKNENDFFDYTSQTGMTEWNLTHHLCNELSKYIFWLNNEVDVAKRNYENKRPDIIFHKRRTNKFNLLVVEAKKNCNDKRQDMNKLKMNWMMKPLSYRFGVYINIWGNQQYEAILIKRNGEEIQINETNSKYIASAIIKDQFKDSIKKVMEEIGIDPSREPLEKLLEEKLDKEVLRVFSLEEWNIR
ncbi:hypothetical protein D3P07_19820 [Paenibacillus sp. 1011MAR3C5]|uniref:hypothetical protein n=1 Tax=Paenibacillus sp. 1011MAR3C5 TaxID=1675787 RepID=UPI000E6B5632|nr:hypothetical protein [Paenibacillus sp. 1011MAR3C5]RJE86317.1 hypothetical protein D3P07_19820 [Paenibacillus sp. 1011MAR3C5]